MLDYVGLPLAVIGVLVVWFARRRLREYPPHVDRPHTIELLLYAGGYFAFLGIAALVAKLAGHPPSQFGVFEVVVAFVVLATASLLWMFDRHNRRDSAITPQSTEDAQE